MAMTERNRRVSPKGMIEKMTGRKMEINLLPAIHKVQILEYMLTCSREEVQQLGADGMCAFVVMNAKMLCEGRMVDYMNVLRQCRLMAKEETLNGTK